MSHTLIEVILVITYGFVIFATIIIILFMIVKSNHFDKIAMTYIWNSHDISNQVGKVIHVGRYVFKKTTKDNSEMSIPYLVETSNGKNTIFITLNKIDGTWNVSSYTIEDRR